MPLPENFAVWSVDLASNRANAFDGIEREEGWGPEFGPGGSRFPSNTTFNQLLYEFTLLARTLETGGLLEFDTAVPYRKDSLCRTPDGLPYISLKDGNKANPPQTSPTWWRLL